MSSPGLLDILTSLASERLEVRPPRAGFRGLAAVTTRRRRGVACREDVYLSPAARRLVDSFEAVGRTHVG